MANNVLVYGTGALNIDGCRITAADGDAPAKWETPRGGIWSTDSGASAELGTQELGRWPANLIHDGSEEALAGFPETSSGGGDKGNKAPDTQWGGLRTSAWESKDHEPNSGSAARFFYCTKATSDERGEGNNHPTVKPVDLMRWLCRLITPKGGTILDPFCGSGSTLIAADAEQFDAIGCELSPDYAAIAERRVRASAGMFAQVTTEAA